MVAHYATAKLIVSKLKRRFGDAHHDGKGHPRKTHRFLV
jgi:hypothetical protein